MARFLNILFFLMIVTSFTLSDMPGFSALSAVLTILFLGMTLLSEGKVVIYKALLLPAGFLVFNLLSILWGGNPDEAGKVTSAVLFGMAVFLGLRKGGRMPLLVAALMICAVFNVALSGNIMEFDGEEAERVSGLFGNANEVAVFLSLSAFLIYFLSARRTVWIKLMVFGLLAFVFIFTGSRQGLFLVAFILGCIFVDFCWSLEGWHRMWRWPLVAGMLLLVFLGVQVAEKYADDVIVLKRLENFLQGTEKGSAQTRRFMIEKGVQLWNAKPIIGWGAAGFVNNGYFSAYAHNTFVELLANYGLIGFMLYYGTFVTILIKGCLWRMRYAPRVGVQIVLMLLVLGSWCVLFRSKSGWLFLAVAVYCVSARGMVFDRVNGRVA